MGIYQKYCIDDLSVDANTRKAIMILEYHTKTSTEYRKPIADHLKNIGLSALSDHLLQPDDYQAFFECAKQEQAERLKKRSPQTAEAQPALTMLEIQYQQAKRKYSACEKSYHSAADSMEKRHLREIEQLKLRQESEIRVLKNNLSAELAKIQQKKSIWHAVNASSHFRKAEQAERAEVLLTNIAPNKIPKKDKKLHSAFLTTFGGVKRDMRKFDEGIKMAQTAHKLVPKDYRPCTLLGALHFEIREYDTGSEWFEKAEKLGAPQHNTDAEIKAIYRKADKEGKAKLKAYLLKLDPKRYAWVNKK